MQPVIDICNLGNAFGEHWVHKGLNMQVQQGDIVALVGGSGCGKTTVLRVILMLLKPTEGEVKVFGIDVSKASPQQANALRRRWGVLFQRGALFSSLTVLENIMFPLREFTQLTLADCKEIAHIKLALVGLSADAADKYPAELSGGMQKRAAAARAIVMDPELLLLDEPTSGLDPASAAKFDQLILQLREMLNLTVVMVSHDLNSLWQVPDQVAFLGNKKVIAQAATAELVKHPDPLIQQYFDLSLVTKRRDKQP